MPRNFKVTREAFERGNVYSASREEIIHYLDQLFPEHAADMQGMMTQTLIALLHHHESLRQERDSKRQSTLALVVAILGLVIAAASLALSIDSIRNNSRPIQQSNKSTNQLDDSSKSQQSTAPPPPNKDTLPKAEPQQSPKDEPSPTHPQPK